MVMLLIAILVVIPAAAGVVLISRSRRGGAPYPTCGRCAYDLSGSIGATIRCPECGSAFAEVGIVPPRRQRKPAMLWSGVGLLVVACIFSVGTMGAIMAVRAAERAQAQAAAAAAMQQQLRQQQLLQQQLTQVQSQQATERDADDEDDGNALDEPDSP